MTKLVGILNLTPDSFSDGGKHVEPDAALGAALDMAKAGAAVVDAGAESTRPGATPLSPEEEWVRLGPFFSNVWPQLCGKIQLSIDTRHAATVKRVLALGAGWINDVDGFSQGAMVEAVKKSECKLVVMHSLTVPADPRVTLPEGCDVVAEVKRYFEARVEALEEQGISRERIILDPGIGFGKTAAQSWELLHSVALLRVDGCQLLVGHSRKSFLGGELSDRDARTLEVSRILANAGVDYLRVHNVALHREIAP